MTDSKKLISGRQDVRRLQFVDRVEEANDVICWGRGFCPIRISAHPPIRRDTDKPFFDSREGLLLKSIRETREVQDAEHIIEILDTIADLRSSPARKFFENTTLNVPNLGSIAYRDFEQVADSLRDKIRTEIFRAYSWKTKSGEKFGLYNDLFEVVDNAILNVFTTNYDRVIEEYCASSANVQLLDGFVHDQKRRIWEWEPSTGFKVNGNNRDELPVRSIVLHKLHGSLNWRRTAEGKIEQVRPEERIGVGGENSFVENLLIYPGGKDQPISEPFRELYKTYETQLQKVIVCVVVGFSFRDEYLNIGFSGFLNRKDTTLVVISPSATSSVQQNLLNGASLDDLRKTHRLITIDKPFENEALMALGEGLRSAA